MDSLKLKVVIGRTEKVDFPKLGMYNIPAKIDTGAYSTAMHCNNIHEEDGVLHFKLADSSHPEYSSKELTFTEYTQKRVKNSFGEMELRYSIKTPVRIGKKLIKATISLTNRGSMKYPVLIGRTLLRNNFLVDVGLTDHLSIK